MTGGRSNFHGFDNDQLPLEQPAKAATSGSRNIDPALFIPIPSAEAVAALEIPPEAGKVVRTWRPDGPIADGSSVVNVYWKRKAMQGFRVNTTRISWVAVSLVAATATFAPAHQEADQPPKREATTSPAQHETTESPDLSGPSTSAGPLLREGSYLVEVRGTMRFNEATKWWRFTIDREDPKHAAYELALLPCQLMADMRRITQGMPQQEVVFEATGQVFVYRGRNFFLPTHAPHVVGIAARPESPAQEDQPDEGADADSAESILRNLDQAVGEIARSPAVGGGAAAVEAGEVELIQEGTQVVARRGRMSRGPRGTWWYTFDADAQGLADPPMVLLPCLLRERMERYAERSGGRAAMLLSGRVFQYEDRNYILPTMFQIPRERTALHP